MSKEPILELHPTVSAAIIQLILFLTGLGLFVWWPLFAFAKWRLKGDPVELDIIMFAMVFVIIMAIVIVGMNLNATRYLFYKNKAEFYEGFLNTIQKTVQYDRVTDCVLTKSVLDRIFGTGSIRLITAGHGDSSSGIWIAYIKNPDEVYQKVQALLKAR